MSCDQIFDKMTYGSIPVTPAAVLKDSDRKQLRRVYFDLKSQGLDVSNLGIPELRDDIST